MSSRRERKKEETRGSILANAIALFKAQGYYKTSMDEIAEKVDVSKPTLYNYFPDKGSMLIAYFQSAFAEYGKDMEASFQSSQGIREKLEHLLDFKNQTLGDDIELTANYLKYRLQTIFERDLFDNPDRSGLENVILKIMVEAQQSGELRGDTPPLVMTRTFLLLTVSYFLSSLHIEDERERKKLKDQLLRLFLDGAKVE